MNRKTKTNIIQDHKHNHLLRIYQTKKVHKSSLFVESSQGLKLFWLAYQELLHIFLTVKWSQFLPFVYRNSNYRVQKWVFSLLFYLFFIWHLECLCNISPNGLIWESILLLGHLLEVYHFCLMDLLLFLIFLSKYNFFIDNLSILL